MSRRIQRSLQVTLSPSESPKNEQVLDSLSVSDSYSGSDSEEEVDSFS